MVDQNQKVAPLGDGRPLRVYWSKREHDFMIDSPTGTSGHLMADVLHSLGPDLDARGYDITTLRFSVKQKKPAEPKDGE